jgi:hypothetical protein
VSDFMDCIITQTYQVTTYPHLAPFSPILATGARLALSHIAIAAAWHWMDASPPTSRQSPYDPASAAADRRALVRSLRAVRHHDSLRVRPHPHGIPGWRSSGQNCHTVFAARCDSSVVAMISSCPRHRARPRISKLDDPMQLKARNRASRPACNPGLRRASRGSRTERL